MIKTLFLLTPIGQFILLDCGLVKKLSLDCPVSQRIPLTNPLLKRVELATPFPLEAL